MHVMLTFLLVNGIRLNCSNEDVVEAGLGVASYHGLQAAAAVDQAPQRNLNDYHIPKGRRINLIG